MIDLGLGTETVESVKTRCGETFLLDLFRFAAAGCILALVLMVPYTWLITKIIQNRRSSNSASWLTIAVVSLYVCVFAHVTLFCVNFGLHFFGVPKSGLEEAALHYKYPKIPLQWINNFPLVIGTMINCVILTWRPYVIRDYKRGAIAIPTVFISIATVSGLTGVALRPFSVHKPDQTSDTSVLSFIFIATFYALSLLTTFITSGSSAIRLYQMTKSPPSSRSTKMIHHRSIGVVTESGILYTIGLAIYIVVTVKANADKELALLAAPGMVLCTATVPTWIVYRVHQARLMDASELITSQLGGTSMDHIRSSVRKSASKDDEDNYDDVIWITSSKGLSEQGSRVVDVEMMNDLSSTSSWTDSASTLVADLEGGK